MSNQIEQTKLPLSLKLIGVLYLVTSAVVALASYAFLQFANTFLCFSSSCTTTEDVIVFLLGLLVAIVIFIIGFGILKRNKLAWFISPSPFLIIVGALLYFGIIYELLIIFLILFTILWKLWEYRRVFGI